MTNAWPAEPYLPQNHWYLTTEWQPIYCTTSTSVLWIRNCSIHSKPLMSHELRGLAGSWRTLLHMQQWEAGGRHGRHLESMTSYRKSDSIIRCIFTWRTNPAKFHPDQIWNDGDLGFFKQINPNKNKKNKMMGSDMGSVPDPTTSSESHHIVTLRSMTHTPEIDSRNLVPNCWLTAWLGVLLPVSSGTRFWHRLKHCNIPSTTEMMSYDRSLVTV